MPNSLDAAYERSLLGRVAVAVVGTSSITISGPNPRRIGLILHGNAGGRTTYAFGHPAADQQGVVIVQNGNPMILWRRDLGSLMEMDINVISTVAGQTLAIVEVSEP